MSTISLKLPEVLKQRVAKAALNQALTPHAFMVQAIEQVIIAAAESRAELVAQSMQSLDISLKSGEGYDAEQVHTYLKARISRQTPASCKTDERQRYPS